MHSYFITLFALISISYKLHFVWKIYKKWRENLPMLSQTKITLNDTYAKWNYGIKLYETQVHHLSVTEIMLSGSGSYILRFRVI